MDKTTTRMFRIACGMVITVCGMVISVPVIKGVLWARGQFHFTQCVDESRRQWPSMSRRDAGRNCKYLKYDPDFF